MLPFLCRFSHAALLLYQTLSPLSTPFLKKFQKNISPQKIILIPAIMTITANINLSTFAFNLSVRKAPIIPPITAGNINLPTRSAFAAPLKLYIITLTNDSGSTQATTVAKLSLAAASSRLGFIIAITNIKRTPDPAPRNPFISPAAAPVSTEYAIFFLTSFSTITLTLFSH